MPLQRILSLIVAFQSVPTMAALLWEMMDNLGDFTYRHDRAAWWRSVAELTA
jgi:hypothetical protein